MNAFLKRLPPSLLLGAIVLAACSGGATPTEGSDAPPVVVDDFAVIADGRLLPRQFLQLSFGMGGKVAEVRVAEGAPVTQGEVMARLENGEALQAEVARAQMEFLSAGQALADLNESADLAKAQAQQAVADAQAALDKTRRDLRSVQNPAGQSLYDAVADTQLALETAQANLQLANVSPEVQAYYRAVVATDQAFRAFQDMKARYDASNGDTTLYNWMQTAEAAYQSALSNQQALSLQIGTTKANQTDAVADAQTRYDRAVANLNAALDGPDAIKLAQAQAKAAVAEAALAKAQADFEKVQSGPDPDQLALIEARLASAEDALAAAKAALGNAELRAPFAGTVANLSLKVGEQVAPGQPAASLADFSGWVVETDNLTEIDVVKIEPGQAVSVVLDALPDQTLLGQVESIDSVYVEKRGDITYTVTVGLADTHPQMRWGMTAVATFEK